MKTLNQNQLAAALELLTKRNETGYATVTKQSVCYKEVLAVITAGKKEIRPCYTSGSGRYISNQDHSNAIESILKKLGIEFEKTNTSPRGGATGQLITITSVIEA